MYAFDKDKIHYFGLSESTKDNEYLVVRLKNLIFVKENGHECIIYTSFRFNEIFELI